MTESEILDKARAIVLARRLRRGAAVSAPSDSARHIMLALSPHKSEVFGVLFLDNRHRVIRWCEMFFGTISGASVHPREVVRKALELNAAACIFAHNHPSGVQEPSRADDAITRRLQEALALVDVRVIDHIVVADDRTYSYAEHGKL